MGEEFRREIKSGKVFLTPGKKVVVIPRGLLKVSDANTNDNALIFAVAEAAFFVQEIAVILSASIWTIGYGCCDFISPSDKA